MARKLLIDMIKLRSALSADPEIPLPEGYFSRHGSQGLKSIRELATFRFACRKCEDAPCIGVCPADALEKDPEGLIDRHTNLCIACKSCVTICPFGTMMTDFFTHHRNKDLFYDLNDEKELELFVQACPRDTVSFTDSGEQPEKNIYRLNDRVLVREYLYSEKQ
ncbi:MAG: 4Fe-4S dicluster domain-containing protein [Bacteroidales bacterium]